MTYINENDENGYWLLATSQKPHSLIHLRLEFSYHAMNSAWKLSGHAI
jgi:hypothetical protein